MKGKDKTDTEHALIDAVIERPFSFKIEGDVFYIYPLTLGKTLIMQRIMRQMGMKGENIKTDMNLEFLRVVKAQRDSCCEMLAYLTARNEYYDVFDLSALEKRKKVFSSLSDNDLAAFMVLAMTADKTDTFVKFLGVDREQKEMGKVMKVKTRNDKNSFSFGGVSLYGSLIDPVMERYGMTKRQAVWELDYVSLRLLMADRINSIYVTDEERKKIRVSRDRRRVDGDNKEDVLRFIRSQDWD